MYIIAISVTILIIIFLYLENRFLRSELLKINDYINRNNNQIILDFQEFKNKIDKIDKEIKDINREKADIKKEVNGLTYRTIYG
jgi:hypothetical protein